MEIKKKTPLFQNQRKKMIREFCPDIEMEFGYLNVNTGEIHRVQSRSTPIKEFECNPDLIKLYEEAHVKIYDILQLDLCPTRSNHINLSLDGVQESRSTNISTDIYSFTFKNCQKVYPLKMIRPINKYKTDDRRHLQEVLQDINENDLIIDDIIGDKPKRSFMKEAMNQNSKFACEYCESPAVHVIDEKKIEEIKKKYALQKESILTQIENINSNPGTSSNVKKAENLNKLIKSIEIDMKTELKKYTSTHLCWPHTTANGNPRTLENVNEIVNIIENANGPLERDVTKGITGRSLLLDQPNFHYVKNFAAEYMHSVCIGVVKRLTELTFKVGQVRIRNTKRKLSDPKTFNRLIKNVQVPNECGRRIRNLDFAVFKATEFRNIILFFFVIVIECIEHEFVTERKIWLQLAFIVRACVLSNEEYGKINQNIIKAQSEGFYKNYEKMFTAKNCTYSTHIVGSHLMEIRGDEPLPAKSAFIYENFYAEMKNLFCAGTRSPLKQVFKNCFIKRQLKEHQCVSKIIYSKMPPMDKLNIGKENNHSVYVLNENGHSMYNIIDEHDRNTFICTKQGKFEAKFNELKNVQWSSIGVYKLGPVCDQPIRIPKKNIAGKVIHVGNYLITCPNHVLREK